MQIRNDLLAVRTAVFALGLAGSASTLAAQSITIGPDVPHDTQRQAASPIFNTELALWAWQQFAAPGWKATYDAASGSFQRGTTDTSWKPSDSTPDTVAWETYAHRSEVRPRVVPLTASFDSEPTI